MPLLVTGAEGEWALFNNTLSLVGADDKRRGSVHLTTGDEMFKAFPGTRDMWFHVRIAGENINSNSSSPRNYFKIRNSSNVLLAGLTEVITSFSGTWPTAFQYGTSNAGGVATDAQSFDADNQAFFDYDIRIQITTGSNPDDTMTVTFYRAGQLRLTQVTVDASGWDLPDNVLFESKNTNGNYDDTYVQDFIVSDSVPTVGMELAVLIPSAVGNYSDFANDYTNIDDNGYDASTVISTSTVTDRESWVFSTPTFDLGDKVIYAVVLDTVAQTDLGAIIADFQPFLRISATDYAGTNLGANNIAPDSYVTIYTQNPDTSQPWQQADLTGLEAGMLAV